MPPSDDHATAYLEKRTLLLLLVMVTLALGWILLPFYGAILWGLIIALLFRPLFRWLLPRLKGRPTLAVETTGVYQRIQSGELNPTSYFRHLFDALPQWVNSLLDRFGLVNFSALQRRLTAALAQGRQFIATQALSLGQDTFDFVASLFITLYLAFFLIRDGDIVARALRQAIPLAPEHKQELLSKFTTVIRATVKGNLLVAAIQGALGGLAFWFLGVTGAVLWAVLMAFLSLLPAVGAGLVWVPVALYLLLTGALWQRHAHARLRGADHHPRRHGRAGHQRLRGGPHDRGHVHRGLAHLRDHPALTVASHVMAVVGSQQVTKKPGRVDTPWSKRLRRWHPVAPQHAAAGQATLTRIVSIARLTSSTAPTPG
jgi:predicted PurR-regulated permease PerM